MTSVQWEVGSPADVHVRRVGIYDSSARVAAYELHFADLGHRGWDRGNQDAAARLVTSTLTEVPAERLSGGLPLLVDVPRAFLVGDLPVPGRPGCLVAGIAPDVPVDPLLLEGLRRLRTQGFGVAVAGFLGERHREVLLPLADYVGIDVQAAGSALPRLVALVRAHAPGAGVVLHGVPDDAPVEEYVQLGCELFHGRALHRGALRAESLSPTQVMCVRLLAVLGSGDPSPGELEQVVSADPGLTLRVLRAATSAATGTSGSVRSLRQALVLLGPRTLSSWVVLTLLGGVSVVQSDRLALVLARANACASLSAAEEVDVAYTVGLLSGLCDVLGADPADLAERTGVAEQTRQALVENTGPCGLALAAVLAHEADWATGVREAGFSVFDVSRAYLTALADAMRTVAELLG